MILDILNQLQNYFKNFVLEVKSEMPLFPFDQLLHRVKPYHPIVLSSDGSNNNRYSYIGLQPIASLYGDYQGSCITLHESDNLSQRYDYDVFEIIEKLFQNTSITSYPFFTGGAVGIIPYRYNFKRNFLYGDKRKNLQKFVNTQAFFYIVTTIIVYDHIEQSYCICLDKNDTSIIDKILSTESDISNNSIKKTLVSKKELSTLDILQSQIDFPTYKQKIEKALHHLKYGDIYQVNIAVPFQTLIPKEFDAFDFYCFFQNRSPSPYGGYFSNHDVQLICNSPECFLIYQAYSRYIFTFPIKGTSKRHDNETIDHNMSVSLLNSMKDSAEHVMIVDLERNDFSKIAEPKSVKVEEYKKLSTFSTVHHLISKISAKVKKNVSLQNIINATFPTGSITGAPKKRAIEIIDEIESFERGYYTGSLGYIGYDTSFCFNVLIRTAECFHEQLLLKLGSGVVIDSTAEKEYEEILAKGLAFATLLKEYQRQN